MLVWVITLSTFLMCLLGGLALYAYLNSHEVLKGWRRRLEARTEAPTSAWGTDGFTALMTQLEALLERLGQATKPKDETEVSSLRKRLITAGYRHPKAPAIFLGAKLVCGVFALLGVALIPVKVLEFPSFQLQMGLYVGAALAGYYGPNLWLRVAINERKRKLLHALPDALDLMVVCVEAGLGLDAAIARVGDEIKFAHEELSEEFNIMSLELRTGLGRIDALRNFSQRMDLDEIKSLVALLIQTDRFGTSVGQALRVYSESMRTSRHLKAEEQAAKLPIKMLFPLIFFVFPSLFIIILGPAGIKVWRTLFPVLGK